MASTVCSLCSASPPDLAACSRCKSAWYCGVQCQREHWTGGHKQACVPAKASQDCCVPSSRFACANCAAEDGVDGVATKPCSKCKAVFYCSKACQVAHWKAKYGHKAACVSPEQRKPSVSAAEEGTFQCSAQCAAKLEDCDMVELLCHHKLHEACMERMSACPQCREPFKKPADLLAGLPSIDAAFQAFHGPEFVNYVCDVTQAVFLGSSEALALFDSLTLRAAQEQSPCSIDLVELWSAVYNFVVFRNPLNTNVIKLMAHCIMCGNRDTALELARKFLGHPSFSVITLINLVTLAKYDDNEADPIESRLPIAMALRMMMEMFNEPRKTYILEFEADFLHREGKIRMQAGDISGAKMLLAKAIEMYEIEIADYDNAGATVAEKKKLLCRLLASQTLLGVRTSKTQARITALNA